jgi:hypothetical protein
MVNESNVLNNIIDKVKQNKVKDEISYPNIITNDEKKTVFYDHGYPEDNTILTLTKRN